MEHRMTIYWIRADNDNALATMAAVERALNGDQDATTDENVMASMQSDPTAGDTYLADNLALARAAWAVDPHRIVASQRPGLAKALNGFQHLVRRATWWYSLPQWLQITEFQGSVVRIVDSLLEHQRRLNERLNRGVIEDACLLGHIRALEDRVRALDDERQALRRRVTDLEQRLAAQEQAVRSDEARP
jgi:hypothetical protein